MKYTFILFFKQKTAYDMRISDWSSDVCSSDLDAIPLIDFHEAPPALPWTLDDAVALCRKIEKIAPEYGAHVALTGGTLYKDGPRKDVDLLFYRIRQVKEIDRPRLLRALQRIGVEISKRHGWVQQAFYEGKPIDLFFPAHIDGARDEAGASA